MNIRQAKEEIRNTIRCYLKKDETGSYEIPVEKQRPVLLIGPPGIGKTAIMEQVAAECGINLVSYTITHHTRQSAIGLPFLSKRCYGGNEVSVTEYTMSEIIASVYEQIERSGIREGILFLDEINCVSETLAPTMLQFLQYKTFGAHRVPDGFLIVTAGNPPQYNRSVRDFDIVTLDRVKKITVEEDFGVWKEYARQIGVHGAILSYLEIRKEHFYMVRAEGGELAFVTARGWEDLSRMITVYEEEGLPVTRDLTAQYLQDAQIAQGFADYYALYHRYREIYRIPEILAGAAPEGAERLAGAAFDEKLSVLGLLLDAIAQECRIYAADKALQEQILLNLRSARGRMKETEEAAGAAESLQAEATLLRADAERKRRAGLFARGEERELKRAEAALSGLAGTIKEAETGDPAADFQRMQAWFAAREKRRQEAAAETSAHLTNIFAFLSRTFGEGQELVIFLTEFAGSADCLRFVQENGNEAYDRYNRLLLVRERRDELRAEAMALLDEEGGTE